MKSVIRRGFAESEVLKGGFAVVLTSEGETQLHDTACML